VSWQRGQDALGGNDGVPERLEATKRSALTEEIGGDEAILSGAPRGEEEMSWKASRARARGLLTDGKEVPVRRARHPGLLDVQAAVGGRSLRWPAASFYVQVWVHSVPNPLSERQRSMRGRAMLPLRGWVGARRVEPSSLHDLLPVGSEFLVGYARESRSSGNRGRARAGKRHSGWRKSPRPLLRHLAPRRSLQALPHLRESCQEGVHPAGEARIARKRIRPSSPIRR
jgi:hypothetical protein